MQHEIVDGRCRRFVGVFAGLGLAAIAAAQLHEYAVKAKQQQQQDGKLNDIKHQLTFNFKIELKHCIFTLSKRMNERPSERANTHTRLNNYTYVVCWASKWVVALKTSACGEMPAIEWGFRGKESSGNKGFRGEMGAMCSGKKTLFVLKE